MEPDISPPSFTAGGRPAGVPAYSCRAPGPSDRGISYRLRASHEPALQHQRWTVQSYLMIFVFIGPVLYTLTALGLFRGVPIAGFMMCFILIGPGVAEFTHFIFPALRPDVMPTWPRPFRQWSDGANSCRICQTFGCMLRGVTTFLACTRQFCLCSRVSTESASYSPPAQPVNEMRRPVSGGMRLRR
jgi:hypothetical protein